MNIYQSPLCSCIICKAVKSSKGIHSHYVISHTVQGNKKHSDNIKFLPKDTSTKTYNKNVHEYNKNPSICCNIECKSIMPYNKRNNKFCCNSCAAKYNNKARNISGWKQTDYQEEIARKNAKKKAPWCKIFYCNACGKIHASFSLSTQCMCGLSLKTRSFSGLNKYFNLNLSNMGTIKFIDDFNQCRKDAFELYKNNSTVSLAKLLNHPDNTGGNLAKLLKNLDIPLDTRSVSQFKSLKQNRSELRSCYQFKCGWITIKDKDHYYRSSYELDFLNYLASKNVDFTMESIRIEYYDSVTQKLRMALPDFIIGNTIVEVKSEYWYTEQNMIDRFQSYVKHGYIPYLLLEKKWYVLDSGLEPKIMRYKGMVIPV